MPENIPQETTAPPHAQLIQMATACWISRIVYMAARLGLADHLSEGAKSATELAGRPVPHDPGQLSQSDEERR